MGTYKGYRGTADKVMDDADVIVNRLKTTPVIIDNLMREYHCSYKTLMRAIYTRLSKEQYRQIAIRHMSRGNEHTCFKKGHKTWNKNVKGMHYSPATEFKKGHLPANHQEVGAVLVKSKNGKQYRRIKISGKDQGKHRWISYAQYLWEKENGPIPKGKLVAHINGDSMDDGPENLVMVDRGGLINLMRKNNPGQRKKAIRNLKKTCRRRRAERTKKQRFQLKLQKRIEKQEAEDRGHRDIAEAGIIKLRGPLVKWHECKGCGYEMSPPRPPCPKCGHLVFEEIEQPIEYARRHAALNE
ncbi:MAG TPA: HNH endonuclease [Sedimentisphaerales bacterium]|nr:HNH endonuclease [Sedimentisphaerales bacterium]HUU15600.1 HNH endonuclease [Sedimentisphaerales bacterium]